MASTTSNSGDVGFCAVVGHSAGIMVEWDGDTVIRVNGPAGNCQFCQNAELCKLYQKHPVGYVRSYPASTQ